MMSGVICILCGILTGFFYDFFKALRKTGKYGGFLTVLADLLFWIIAGGLCTAVLFYIDGLQIRLYRLCTVLIGVILYFSFLSAFFLNVSEKIFKIFALFFKILFTIVKFCAKIIYTVIKFLLFPFRFLGKLAGNYWIKLKKFIKITKRV